MAWAVEVAVCAERAHFHSRVGFGGAASSTQRLGSTFSEHMAGEDHPRPLRIGKNRWSGHAAMSALAEELPPGAQNIQELYDWPQAAAAGLNDDELLRLSMVLGGSMVVYSDYSGMDTYREALELGSKAAMRRLGVELPDNGLQFVRACDIAKTPQKILCSISNMYDKGRSCVFADIRDRLVPAAQRFLQEAAPEGKTNREVAVAAYSAITEWAMVNRSWIFAQSSPCLQHGKDCPAHPAQGGGPSSKRARLESKAGQGIEHECITESAKAKGMPPLFVHTSGMSCEGWSSVGDQLQFGDRTELINAIFVAERRRRAEDGDEDIFFGECTPRFDVHKKLVQPLADTHDIYWLVTGPECFGWPCRRERMFCVGINKKRIVWAGPTDYRADFMQKYYRAAQVRGDIFMCAPDEQVHSYYSQLAKAQGHDIPPEIIAKTDMTTLLPLLVSAGKYQIFREYVELKPLHQSMGGVFLADICQHPNTASSCGPTFPTQLKHGLICTIQGRHDEEVRFATGMEHLGAQGYHLFPETSGNNGFSKMLPIFLQLTHPDQKSISGNGMHLAPLSAWMLYTLSNILRIPEGAQSMVVPFTGCIDDDFD